MKFRRPDDAGVEDRSPRLGTMAFGIARPTSLCEYCISVRIPQRETDWGHVIYCRRVRDMTEAAKGQSHCELCRFLTRRLNLKFSEESVQNKGDMIVSLRISRNAKLPPMPSTKLPTQVELKLGNDQISLAFDICKLSSESSDADLGVFDDQYPEPHPKVQNGGMRYLPRIVNSNPLSEATIGLVKDWLSTCRSHRRCKAQETRSLPTRVIDIRTENPKIIESDSLTGSYIALSHCWGSTEDTFSTTAQNIAQRKAMGLELSQIPLNFRDAVIFTRRLGFDYLWVDSLCILQQDVQDWRHEAGRMAGYYNNAIVTLAIADAIDCQAGFLHRRRHDHSPPIPRDNGEFYCLRELLPEEYHLNISSSISKRAWTLQERLLSPRVIHFTQDQVFWHCRQDAWAESYIYKDFHKNAGPHCGHAGKFIDRAEHDTYWRRMSSKGTDNVFMQDHNNLAAQTWYDCVSEFSTRSLTRASDKFAAIAGLANKFCQPELGQYMAGLWEQDLFRGLTWKRIEPVEPREDQRYSSRSFLYIALKAKRNLAAGEYESPLDYRAPSWSWASVNGPVDVDSSMFYHVQLPPSNPQEYEFDHWKRDCGPRLVSSHLIHSSNNPYVDTLEGSFIEVKGNYRKLWIAKVKLSPEPDELDGLFIENIIFDNTSPDQTFTYLSQPDQLDQVWKELLMFQICKERKGDWLVYALLLEKMQDPTSFKRIGLVKLACYNLCEITRRMGTLFGSLRILSTTPRLSFPVKESTTKPKSGRKIVGRRAR